MVITICIYPTVHIIAVHFCGRRKPYCGEVGNHHQRNRRGVSNRSELPFLPSAVSLASSVSLLCRTSTGRSKTRIWHIFGHGKSPCRAAMAAAARRKRGPSVPHRCVTNVALRPSVAHRDDDAAGGRRWPGGGGGGRPRTRPHPTWLPMRVRETGGGSRSDVAG